MYVHNVRNIVVFCKVYKAFSNEVTIDKIKVLLERLNNEYSLGNMCRPHTCYKSNVIDKCKKYNMWLFIEKTIPAVHIEQLLR